MAIANKGQKVASEQREASQGSIKPTSGVTLQEQGERILNAKTEEELQTLGSRSGDWKFISLITNPYFPVSRKVNGDVVAGEETVGAIFENVSDEPIEVTIVPNKSFEVMDADFEKATSQVVKPGEKVQLNSIEVGILLTRDEYGGYVNGGGIGIQYTSQTPKDQTKLPTTKLRFSKTVGGSVKDQAVSIATIQEDGKTKVMKDEFKEKFEIFSTRKGRSKGSAGGSSKKAKVNTASLAVQAIFKQKLGQ